MLIHINLHIKPLRGVKLFLPLQCNVEVAHNRADIRKFMVRLKGRTST